MTARYATAKAVRELAARLSQRDCAVIRSVSELHFVTGSQLTRLCFEGSPDAADNARAARRALLRLTRLGALARLPRPIGGVRAGSAGFVYRLAPAGQRLAVLYGWQPERLRWRSFTPGTLFLRHTLLIAELHTRLREHERSRSFELLELEPEPSCWRSYDGLSGPALLKPDSYLRLGLGDFEDSYFIEIDRSTEGSRTIVRQLTIYSAYQRSGREQAERGVFPRVLWLVPDEQRASVIEDCIERLAPLEQQLFQIAQFDSALALLTSPTP